MRRRASTSASRANSAAARPASVRWRECSQVLRLMKDHGVPPDSTTLNILVDACVKQVLTLSHRMCSLYRECMLGINKILRQAGALTLSIDCSLFTGREHSKKTMCTLLLSHRRAWVLLRALAHTGSILGTCCITCLCVCVTETNVFSPGHVLYTAFIHSHKLSSCVMCVRVRVRVRVRIRVRVLLSTCVHIHSFMYTYIHT